MNDITVNFKGDGRRGEEGGVRRKGARRRSKMRPLMRKVRRKCDPFVNKCPPSSLLQWANTLATSPACSTSMRHALTSNSPMPVDARANAEQKSEMSAAISARLGYRSLQPHCPSPSPFSFSSCSLRTSLAAQGPQTSNGRAIRSPISLRALFSHFSRMPLGISRQRNLLSRQGIVR